MCFFTSLVKVLARTFAQRGTHLNAMTSMHLAAPVHRAARRRAGWVLLCAAMAIAPHTAADVVERDVTPQVERAQAQQRLDLSLRQARRPQPPGLVSSDASLRLGQRHAVERLRQQALQSEQRFELGRRRGQPDGAARESLQQRFAQQHREQMRRNRDYP